MKVTRALEDMEIGADNNDPASTIDAHMAFHRAFYELSDHKLLLDLWKSWEAQLQMFFSADHQSFEDLHEVVAEHVRLLAIVDRGDIAEIIREIDRARAQAGAREAEASGRRRRCVSTSISSAASRPTTPWTPPTSRRSPA